MIYGSLPILLVILGIMYPISRFDDLSSSLVAWGTLMLAIATFTLVQHSREQEKQRRRSELAKEERDKNEKLLNEIVDWATVISSWRLEYRRIFTEVVKIPDTKESIRFVYAHILEVESNFEGLEGRNIYACAIAEKFEQSLQMLISDMLQNMSEYLKFLKKWSSSLSEEISKGSLQLRDGDVKEADRLANKLDLSTAKILEKVAEIKCKHLSTTSNVS